MAEATELVEQQPPATAEVDATAGPAEDMAAGGNQFDSEKNAFVNKTPRNEQGRFAKVRESLERSQRKTSYIQALQSGAVEPTEEMSPDEWSLARRAQLQNRTSGITVPDFAAEKPADVATEAAGNTAKQQLTEKEAEQISAHQAFMSATAARIAIDPATRDAVMGFKKAVADGADPQAVDYLGVVISGAENAQDVLLTLGRNQEALGMFSRLPIESMQAAVHALSQQLAGQKKTAVQVPPKEPKPKPPDPVGARASASGFDVNDESIDADSWARQRNEQLAKKGRR